MTICIAAISENQSILAISDKKLTSNHGVTSGYQISENKKIVELNSRCVALFAGDIVNANEVLALAKLSIKADDSVADVADKIKFSYAQRLRTAINDEILSKYGLDIDSFNAQQRTLDPIFVNSVMETINNPQNNLGIEVIIAGKDRSGPHLHKVMHPGTVSDQTPIGYVCVGSGSSHANLSLIESHSHSGMDAGDLTYAILKAKKKAEYDPNVGDMSTLVSIEKEVTWIVDDKLEKLWKDYDKSVKDITAKIKETSIVMKGELYGTTVSK